METNWEKYASLSEILPSTEDSSIGVETSAPGPEGRLPLTERILLEKPSGDLFGWSMDAGMGWAPAQLGAKEFLILSTQGGIRAPDGQPVALGYHTGHWEVGLLMSAAAAELRASSPRRRRRSRPSRAAGRTGWNRGMWWS